MLAIDILEQAALQLDELGIDTPRFDAELLLAHVWNVSRAVALARSNRGLPPPEQGHYQRLLDRRLSREPLAYILGHREFYDLDLIVDKRALVPRPETELLVEEVLRLTHEQEGGLRIADVGTGSGALAVTLAVHLPQATVYAVDASPDALALAAENARRHNVAHRIQFLEGDLLSPLCHPVDMIVANLPYVTSAEWEDLPPEIKDWEPRLALDGGFDGLDAIGPLLSKAGPYLRTGGTVLVEIGASQGPAVMSLAQTHLAGARVRLLQDYAGLDRCVVAELP